MGLAVLGVVALSAACRSQSSVVDDGEAMGTNQRPRTARERAAVSGGDADASVGSAGAKAPSSTAGRAAERAREKSGDALEPTSGGSGSDTEDANDSVPVEDDAGTLADATPPPPPLEPSAVVGRTVALGTMLGMYSDRYQGELYGTDLGYTFEHEGELWVLFGDSWRTDVINTAQFADDAFARISLEAYPDGAAVDAWIDAQSVASGAPAWHAAGPPMDVPLERGPGSRFAPIRVFHDGTELSMGEGFTPLTGFSNARSGSESGAFAVFFRYAHVECDAGRCQSGWVCDSGLGRAALEQFNPPCAVGEGLTCATGPGFCQDRGSSMYDSSTLGRTKSLVVRHEVGFATTADPPRFDTRGWDTHRFFNLTARTVEDFDPARGGGERNDYRTAAGDAIGGDAVLLWGRPHFAGVAAERRDAQLYFAWAPMPVRDAAGEFEWKPRYFAGLDPDGRPRFVEQEVDSQPIDLAAAISGEQPEEQLDIVGQMSVTWLESFQRWVMIYGGDVGDAFAAAVLRGDREKVAWNPHGALFVRMAEQPWGPWTEPRPFFTAGDSERTAPAVDQYAPGGLLHHPNCRGVRCAGNDMGILLDPGVLYAGTIIEPWTVARDGEVSLYWLLSTWNPYHVVLMKSSLTATDFGM